MTVEDKFIHLKFGEIWCPDTSQNSKIWILIMSGHKSKSQNMDFNYVRTQVKIAKYGFICPGTS